MLIYQILLRFGLKKFVNAKLVLKRWRQFLRESGVAWIIWLVFSVVFWGRLFWPEPMIYYTPDWGLSDIWNFHYPIKEILSRVLKRGQLPFWSGSIAEGYPVLAEGQVGALFLPNLILYGLLPTWLAWNLSYVVIIGLAYWGSYVWIRRVSQTKYAEIGAVMFAFGAGMVLHFSNPTFLASVALMPWVFWGIDKLIEKQKPHLVWLVAILVAQQIYAGHFQTVFLTVVMSLLMVISRLSKQMRRQAIVWVGLAMVSGVIWALPQLLSTYQLVKSSGRGLVSEEVGRFKYPTEMLWTWIDPVRFGSAKDGSFGGKQEWGIYWENVYFVSISGLVLAGWGWYSRRRDWLARYCLWSVVIIYLLVLGQNGPLEWVFTLPGFSWFRVASRYLVGVSLCLAVMAPRGAAAIEKRFLGKKVGHAVVLVVSLFLIGWELIHFGAEYHPKVRVDEALAKPASLEFIPEHSRVYTDGSINQLWIEEFSQNGWGEVEKYLEFKAALIPNSALLWNRVNSGYYGVLIPKRTAEFWGKASVERLKLAGVDFKIGILEPGTAEGGENTSGFWSIEKIDGLAKWRLVDQVEEVANQAEALRRINDPEIIDGRKAIVEEAVELEPKGLRKGEVEVLSEKEGEFEFRVKANKEALLVVAESYAENWKAWINGSETRVLPVNLNQLGVVVGPGTSQVKLRYVPDEFWSGVAIGLSWLGVLWMGLRARKG